MLMTNGVTCTNSSDTNFFVFLRFRAEGLAAEIKDLQGQLADYNMVNSCQLKVLVY